MRNRASFTKNVLKRRSLYDKLSAKQIFAWADHRVPQGNKKSDVALLSGQHPDVALEEFYSLRRALSKCMKVVSLILYIVKLNIFDCGIHFFHLKCLIAPFKYFENTDSVKHIKNVIINAHNQNWLLSIYK